MQSKFLYCMYVCMYVCIRTLRKPRWWSFLQDKPIIHQEWTIQHILTVWMYVCMYVCMYVYMYVTIRLHAAPVKPELQAHVPVTRSHTPTYITYIHTLHYIHYIQYIHTWRNTDLHCYTPSTWICGRRCSPRVGWTNSSPTGTAAR